MKKTLKFLSIVLTVVLIIGIFSCATPVFAAEVTEKESLLSTVEQYKTQVEATAECSYEIKEERDRFTKVFKNEDGTKTAIVSATPIHYETAEGWEDIDNTLVEETKVTGSIYKNKNNDFTVTLPQELSSSQKIHIEKDDYSVSFVLEGSDIFSGVKNIKGNKKGKKSKSSYIQNNIDTDFLDKTSGIDFENVGENTSVEYEVTSTGLKENIVLKQRPQEQVTYKYKITAKKLTAELNSDNSVTFKNKDGQAVFEIPAPIMLDSENVLSKDIDVSLNGKNGKYTLVYKPSFDWLSGDVKYPVIIDPVINTTDESLGVKDAVADSANPNDNYADSVILSTYKSNLGQVQSFIDISSNIIVKNGAKIKTVLLGLYYLGGVFIDDSTTVAAYTVTSDWSESTITYNNKPTTIDSLIERIGVSRNTPEGYFVFDVTKAYASKQDTYGVCIRQRDSVTNEAQLVFASSEYQTMSQRPFFVIQYYETQGVEEQFDYHAFDAGRAGKTYFNDFTEQVYIERDELGLSGINMPVQIKRYYNSGLGGTYSNQHLICCNIASSYGFGWRTNYNQSIEYHSDIDNEPTILYCNGEGKVTYFKKDTTDSAGITTWTEKADEFSNTDGYTLLIPQQYENNIQNNLQYVTIKDSSGQIYEFNSSGLLTKINSAEDDSTKNITITHTENGLNISKIIDGVGREYRFSYTKYEEWFLPLLTSIQAYSPSGAAITVTNDSGAKVPYKTNYTYTFSNYFDTEGLPMLSSATYPDGKTVYYSVSDELISLKNIDGYTIEFAFNDNNTTISEKVYSTNGTDFISGGQLTITDENDYEKSFVDINGTKITKQFDMYGRTINTKNNNEINNSVAHVYSDDYKAQGTVTYNFYNTYEQEFTQDETNLITNGSFTTNLNGWTISSSSKVKQTTEHDCVSGTEIPGALQISGVRNTEHFASQTIDVENGVAGDEYRLDYFVKNTTHSHMVVDLLCLNTIIVEARNNVADNEDWKTIAWVDANPFNSKWQKYSYAFEVDIPYNEIRVIICYFDQYGTVRYDGVNLVNTYKANANQNTDNENNNENTGSGSSSSNEIGCECDGCITTNCPCTTCSDNCTLPYCNRGYSFENDSNGIRFSITDGEKTMGMEQNISGNYYSSQFDLNGIYTGYSYDQLNSQLKSISNGEGQVTSFTYDAMNRLKKVSNDVDGLINGNKMETSYSYENDRIKSITHNGFSYNYEYDVWGNPTSVKVGEQTLVSYIYDSYNQTRDRVNRITYGNGDYADYSYNDNGNIQAIKSYSSEGSLVADYEYIYDENAQIEKIKNLTENTVVVYTDTGMTFNYLSGDGETVGSEIYSTAINNLNKTVEKVGDINYTEIEEKVENDSVNGTTTVTTSVNFDDNTRYYYNTDTRSDYFGRNEMDKFSMLYDYDESYELYYGTETEYAYKDIPADEVGETDKTTSLVESYKNSLCFDAVIIDEEKLEFELPEDTHMVLHEYEYLYEYDGNGNITKVSTKTLNASNVEIIAEIQSYVYDNVGQLVRENNAELNKTYTYVYDKGGNIVRKTEYAYTTGYLGDALSTVNYTYDSLWKDKLTAYGNSQIQTDPMGNPLNYVGKNLQGEEVNGTLEWNGRQLVAVNQGNKRYEYSYNSDGLRTSVKTYVDNDLMSIQYYIWKNGKLMGYFNEDKNGNNHTSVKMLYDNNNELIGLRLVNKVMSYDKVLFFRKNLQGDILSVCDSFGNQVLTYTYDACGNVNVTVNTDNSQSTVSAAMAIEFVPITYRGYLYDYNTGLYYLQSRYYNPTYGRFLNADATEILEATQGTPLGANLFAYCNNNPVFRVDPTGRNYEGVLDNTDDNNYADIIPLILLFGAFVIFICLLKIIIEVAAWITGLIEDAIVVVRQKICVEIPNTLREQMERAKAKAEERGRCEITNNHHIVAKIDFRADRSRKILDENTININDPANLATINREVHWFLHTTLYHNSVYDYLASVHTKTWCSNSERRLNVIMALWTLNAELMAL